ncbi:YjeJ family protein [Klebsiella oxytoca]|uniref:YjeJ family protein n=1 Tax=Klebsiella oxytoca TaxID=571 RepID=UPI0021E78D70|nr:YjeJ family protein [Klebsiella oxytoca]
MMLKGLNTAPLKHGEHLGLMMFKIKDTNDKQHIMYMQVSTLIDFLIILRARMLKVSQRLSDNGEIYKAKIMASIESLSINTPEIMTNEVTQPDPGNLITGLAPKFKDEQLSLITILQNEKVITLDIDDTQAEFIIIAIQQAFNTIGDNETMLLIGSLLDFILIYSVDLTNLEYLNYSEVNHEVWKKQIYSDYVSVVYCFENEQGMKNLAGAVIKVNTSSAPQDIEKIAQKVAKLTPRFKAIQEKYPLCRAYYEVISCQAEQKLTREECLNHLHAFCLKVQTRLS